MIQQTTDAPRVDLAAKLLLDVNAAAEALSICPRQLWALANAGEIPKIYIGRVVRFAVDDLRGWIERQKNNQEG